MRWYKSFKQIHFEHITTCYSLLSVVEERNVFQVDLRVLTSDIVHKCPIKSTCVVSSYDRRIYVSLFFRFQGGDYYRPRKKAKGSEKHGLLNFRSPRHVRYTVSKDREGDIGVRHLESYNIIF